MSVLNQSGEEQVECPLCMEPLEVDDLNFYPCTCGYQICRFCWHRIRTDENGLCPACRKAYSENPADFTPLSKEQVAQLKAEKRARDQQRKARLSESRKHLASVRVVQRNLVFVVGLPMRLADAEILRRHEYFGKFGRIHKVVINQSTSYAGSQGPSASAYVTYYKSDDALRAIQSVNNIILDGRLIKSSLGTTKYCSHFMKNQLCPKADCMYLHDLGDSEASFTKEEMHQGKHQEYERRLHEQLATQSSLKTQSGATQTCQNGTTIQKEAWPSLSRNGSPPNVGKERKLSASETKQTSQTSKSSSNSEISDVPANNKSNTEVVPSQPLPQSKSEKSQKSKNAKTKHNNSNNNTSSVQNNNFDSTNNNNVNNSNAKNSRKVQDSQKLQTNRTNATNGPANIVQNGSDTDSVSETSQTERRTSDVEPSKRKPVETSEDPRTALSGEKCNRSVGETENPTNSESDRSTDSSPLAQNLSKISLYEDNTSFFSPNTFQKLISDKDGSSNFTETNTMTQASSILNDNLPNISSSEDWEAAFGFSNGKTIFSSNSLENSPGSSSSTVSVPNRNIVAGMSQDVVHGTQAAYGGIGGQFGAENVRLVDGQREISVGPLGNRNSIYVSTPNVAENDVDAIHATAGPNQVFVSENDGPVGGDAARGSVYDGLASVGVPPRSLADAANNMLMNSNIDMKSTIVAETMPSIINGLDQNMYKFFSDFHKNSTVMKDAHDYLPNGFTEHVPNVFNPADVGRQNAGGSVGNGRQLPDHMLAGSNGQQNQQNSLMNPQQNMLYQQQQQRLMEKQLSEQLLSMKNHHSQNGTQSPHGLLSASNQQTFINQHGGYQQNFLLQNQINLVQNQHNLVGGDQHNLNLLGGQQNLAQSIIGSALNGQHSLLGGTGGNGRSLVADHMNVQPTHNLHNLIGATVTQQNSYGFPTQGRAHLAGMIGATNQQRGVDDDLGFDPFHETQKGFAELMESEQVLNNQAQHRTRLPPPGFSHMNAFGIGLPRPHGSKILPFMGLGQGNNTQQPVVSSQQQSTNAWHLPNPQQITSSHKGLGVCNDWTSLDPAIVTSSRHFQFANVGPIRDQFAGVHGIGGPIRNIDFTNNQQQTFSQPQQNGYQTATPNGFSSVQFANQQQQQQQQQQNSGQFGSLVNGFSSGNHNWLSSGTEYQNQIPMPPGFRQSNSQGKTQEC